MKYFVASDIHGYPEYCEKILSAYDREQADRLFLLGDLLYFGPRNPLETTYDPKGVIALLNARKDDLLCVRGNCDSDVDQMVLDFPILADYALLLWEGLRLYATHGHVYNASRLPPLQPGDILLHGHTHIPAWDQVEGRWILNPGSVSIPKENTPHSYMVLEGGVFLWKSLGGEIYHSLSLSP